MQRREKNLKRKLVRLVAQQRQPSKRGAGMLVNPYNGVSVMTQYMEDRRTLRLRARLEGVVVRRMKREGTHLSRHNLDIEMGRL